MLVVKNIGSYGTISKPRAVSTILDANEPWPARACQGSFHSSCNDTMLAVPRPVKSMLYDLFICHASEDKATFVRPLAKALQTENVSVWYDEFTLKLGDSIRRSIDKGLKQSRFGAVVLSPAFFQKAWPQYELDGLAEREMRGADKVILPIWHGVEHDDVMEYSPPLAGRKAVKTSDGITSVVNELLDVIHPQGSPLIIARDILLEWGVTPPVITDQYWLNVVEASNRLPGYGVHIPDESIWYLWSYPLPSKGDAPESWGEKLAFSAMQLEWVKVAERDSIDLLSHPEKVLDFIYSQPGLFETCSSYPDLTSEYAPQLTIPGYGGDLEEFFEAEYQKSCEKCARQTDERFGSGLTTTSKPPLCDEEWALRHPALGNYQSSHIACEYFTGGMFGPVVSPYKHPDHLFWLLSTDSKWLPENVRSMLIDGMRNWGQWHWPEINEDGQWESCGKLFDAMHDAAEKEFAFKWTNTCKNDLRQRIAQTISTLKLTDKVESIYKAFVEFELPNTSYATFRKHVAVKKHGTKAPSYLKQKSQSCSP